MEQVKEVVKIYPSTNHIYVDYPKSTENITFENMEIKIPENCTEFTITVKLKDFE